jgi:hypothetical protein
VSLFGPGNWGAMRVMTVNSGTVIKDDATGEEGVVDNEHVVIKRGTIYVTPATYAALLQDPRIKDLT